MRAPHSSRVTTARLLHSTRALSATICLGLTGVIGQPASAQSTDPPSRPAGPASVLDAERAGASVPFRLKSETIDMGKIRPGGSKTTTFEVYNAARVPVTITRVTSTCSCTAAVMDGVMTVDPEKTGTIEVTISKRSNPGPMSERVTVWYRDPNTGRERNFAVAVKAEIAHAVNASPFFVDLLTQPKRDGVIRLEAGDGRPFRVTSVAGAPAQIVVEELDEGEDPDAARPVQLIRYDFTNQTDEEVGLFLVIETDHPEAEMIDLRVVSNLLLREGQKLQRVQWQVDPQRVLLGQLATGQSTTDHMQIYRIGEEQEAEFSIPSGRVHVTVLEATPNEKGRDYHLEFTVADGAEGLVYDTMLVTVGEHTREVPLYLRVPAQ